MNVPLSTERTIYRLAMLYPQIITWGGVPIGRPPKEVHVSQTIWRDFVCVEGCVACCKQGPLTLDYVPTEIAWTKLPERVKMFFEPRIVSVNSVDYEVMSFSKGVGACPFFKGNMRFGKIGCGIWPNHPIECFAAGRLQIQKSGEDTIILKRIFARTWRWKDTPECKYLLPQPASLVQFTKDLREDQAVLGRYQEWCSYFHLDGAHETLYLIKGLIQQVIDGDRPIPTTSLAIVFEGETNESSVDTTNPKSQADDAV